MRNFKYILILFSFFLFTSCIVSKKNIAKRKLKRNVNRIENILNEYPELSDTVFKTVYDTILIKEKSDSITHKLDVDSVLIDSSINEYINSYNGLELLEKESIELNKIKKSSLGETEKSKVIDKIKRLENDKLILKRRLRKSRDQIFKKTYKNKEYILEDSLVKIIAILKDGEIKISYHKKEEKIPYVKNETKINIDTKISKIYEKPMFWLILIFILSFLIFIKHIVNK